MVYINNGSWCGVIYIINDVCCMLNRSDVIYPSSVFHTYKHLFLSIETANWVGAFLLLQNIVRMMYDTPFFAVFIVHERMFAIVVGSTCKNVSSWAIWIYVCYRYALVGRDLSIYAGKSTVLTSVFRELIDEYMSVFVLVHSFISVCHLFCIFHSGLLFLFLLFKSKHVCVHSLKTYRSNCLCRWVWKCENYMYLFIFYGTSDFRDASSHFFFLCLSNTL